MILFDAQRSKPVQKMAGHSKRVPQLVSPMLALVKWSDGKLLARSSPNLLQVTAVKLHPDKDVVASASQDATVKIWTCSRTTDWSSQCAAQSLNLLRQYLRSLPRYNCLHTIRKHSAEVTDLSIHPLGEHRPHLLRMAACPILHRIRTELLPHGVLGQVLGHSRLSQRPLHTTHAGGRHPCCKLSASTPTTSFHVG